MKALFTDKNGKKIEAECKFNVGDKLYYQLGATVTRVYITSIGFSVDKSRCIKKTICYDDPKLNVCSCIDVNDIDTGYSEIFTSKQKALKIGVVDDIKDYVDEINLKNRGLNKLKAFLKKNQTEKTKC